MAASAKGLAVGDDRTANGEWVVVSSRRGRRSPPVARVKIPEAGESWAPVDSMSDPDRVLKLTQKLEASIKKMESSLFYQTLIEQIEDPQIFGCFRRVLGSDSEMQMVVYGIGSIESYEPPRLQLSLALLMKRKFSWIGRVEVFDPVLSATESRVLESLGCLVLSINEQGRRNAMKPTLFFMPHCEVELYDNLLQANWRADSLQRIALFGNSFETYMHASEFKGSTVHYAKHVLAAREFTDEFKVEIVSDDFFGAFHDSSWHFFGSVLDSALPSICT
ncbi:protein SENSITIVITY TO RED LIGHT REDUCED 1 isoform X2 [Punica granatum]|nr:protein SENSITIVITY TO RED LIGHT REDUCED 1 isoform X2 [Punica granatum]